MNGCSWIQGAERPLLLPCEVSNVLSPPPPLKSYLEASFILVVASFDLYALCNVAYVIFLSWDVLRVSPRPRTFQEFENVQFQFVFKRNEHCLVGRGTFQVAFRLPDIKRRLNW